MFAKTILTTAMLASLTLPALAAQEVSLTTSKEIEVITVTSSRSSVPKSAIPNTIRIIDEEEFSREVQFSGSTTEAISSLVPSFSPTREKLTGSGETLRGRNPLFLIDGVPQANPIRDGSRDGYTVDPFFIESVEVIFGSNAIQGVGATGGVINYKTASAPDEEGIWTGKALAQYSTGSEFQGDSNGYRLAGLIGKDFGNFDLTIGAASQSRGMYYSGDDRRVGVDGAQGEVQNSNSTAFYTKASYNFSNTQRLVVMAQMFELEGNGDYIRVPGSRDTQTPSTSEKGVTLGIIPTNNVTTASATFTDNHFFGGLLTGQFFYQDFEAIYGGDIWIGYQDPNIDPTESFFDQSANNSTKNGARISFERKVDAIEGFRFVAGLDYINDSAFQELIASKRKWVPETTFKSIAPFLQIHQGLFDKKVHVSMGIRNESAEIDVDDYTTLYYYGAQQVGGGNPDFNENLVNIGATVEVTKGFTAYTSFAQGFTMPDVGRVLRGINVPNLTVNDIINLEPIVSDNLELGFDWVMDDISLSAAYYQSESKNGSRLALVDDVYEVQRQLIEIDGVEVNATWYTPVKGLNLSVGYATADGRTDTTGNGKVDRDLNGANISPDRINLTIDYGFNDYLLQIRTRNYLKRDFDGQDDSASFDGHVLVDFFMSYDASFGDIYVSACSGQ